MNGDVNLAPIAALLGEPARANMMMALMDQRALTAKELAYAAHISAQTASAHLAKLLDLGLIVVESRGRNRYYRVVSLLVAQMIEAMALVAPANFRRPQFGEVAQNLRLARTCYDHVAGLLGVAIADRLQSEDYVIIADGGGMVTVKGERFLASLGVESLSPRGSRRVFCRPCLDWTERRHHVAGALGAALCRHCFQRGWVERLRDSRALRISPTGHRALADHFGIDTDKLAASANAVAA